MDSRKPEEFIILMADDDEEDCMLVEEAIRESGASCSISFVHDGEDLLDYLYRRKKYADASSSYPRPHLILLDLNMPRMGGHEALKTIKKDASLKNIPVVVLTTSSAEDDIYGCYDKGVNGYITKPVTFKDLKNAMKSITEYWFEYVNLPPQGEDE